MDEKIIEVLNEFYYNTTLPSSFSSVERLHTELRKNGYKIKKSLVEAWLEKQKTYSLHKNRRIHFKRNHYNITNIDDLWQIDLIDIQKISRSNSGFKFILCAICCFSRFAWCVPIKRKTPNEVIKAFEHIFSLTKRRPLKVQSDAGKEFLAKSIQSFFNQNNIIHYTALDPVTKACICERFIRTIKSLIYKYFTYSGKNKYVHVLNSLVHIYNNRKHSTIGMPPSSVNEKNILNVWNYIDRKRNRLHRIARYSVGDVVRVANAKTVFEKGYKPKWSEETFEIVKVVLKSPVVYRLKDKFNTVIRGNYYEQELQKVGNEQLLYHANEQ